MEATANELSALNAKGSYLRYESHRVDEKNDKVRDVIESKDGAVARLILLNGRPLTADEDAAERARLQTLLDSPAAFAKHIRSEENGRKQMAELIRQVPDAMIFSYAAGQPQRQQHEASEPAELVIDFTPNPAWHPPSLASEGLTGLRGRAWIDARTHYLRRLDGEIFRAVNVGWGVFARIYPGGTISFEQAQVSEKRWSYLRFVDHVTLRALLLKTVKDDSDVTASRFRPVAEMSYQEAIRLLLAAPLPGR